MTEDEKSERVLKALLARASRPDLPPDAEARLMQIVGRTHQDVNVVPFRRNSSALLWAGLPLAASLAAGVYLGTLPSFDRFVTGYDSAGLDVELPTGLEDDDGGTEDVT